MPLPRNPPWPRLPPALLLAAFALAPAARAADGFTEIGIDAPDPVPYAARPSLLADDKEMLEDLVAAAFNDAVRRAAATSEEKMGKLTAGMPLPPGMKFPF